MSAIWVAVTGNIGAGKSTVTNLLKQLGAGVVDADAEAHGMANDDNAYREELTERFGPGLFAADGTFQRAELAHRIFGDPEAVSDFNAIVGPKLVARTRSKLRTLERDHPVVVLDGALIFEYGRHNDFNEVWLVTALTETANARLRARGISDEQIARRREAQWSEEIKRPMATRILENNASLSDLEKLVQLEWNRLNSTK